MGVFDPPCPLSPGLPGCKPPRGVSGCSSPPSTYHRALRRTAGLVLLFLFWALAGAWALAKGTARAFFFVQFIGPPPCAPTNGRPGFPYGFLYSGGRLPKARHGRFLIVQFFFFFFFVQFTTTTSGCLEYMARKKHKRRSPEQTRADPGSTFCCWTCPGCERKSTTCHEEAGSPTVPWRDRVSNGVSCVPPGAL